MGLKEADDMVAAYLERQKENQSKGKERFCKPEEVKLTVAQEMKRLETEIKLIEGQAQTINNAAMAGRILPQQANMELSQLEQKHRKAVERYVHLKEGGAQ